MSLYYNVKLYLEANSKTETEFKFVVLEICEEI